MLPCVVAEVLEMARLLPPAPENGSFIPEPWSPKNRARGLSKSVASRSQAASRGRDELRRSFKARAGS